MAEESENKSQAAPQPAEAQTQAPDQQAQTPAAPPAPAAMPPIPAPPLPEGAQYIWGVGRRKKAIARVRIRPGTGKFTVNKREMDKYFTEERDRLAAISPLKTANMVGSWDIWVTVTGGGFAGQAGALTLGLARALSKAAPTVEGSLRDQGLLTRDARMKERKKYGQKGARKRFQWTKR